MIKKKLLIILLVIVSLIFLLFIIRLISPKEIDDVTPGIFCETKYLEKSDILWVIPDFDNTAISENASWCKHILSLNKTLGMHGIMHAYDEFLVDRNNEYLYRGIKIFEDCFGFRPEMFKPPQLKISDSNTKLIEGNNLKLKMNFNQLVHKVYHCNDEPEFVKNKVIDWV
jgi:predicted deacetylase